MPYGVDNKPFYALQNYLVELPEEPPGSPRELEGALFAFIDAFDRLLALLYAILARCAERDASHAYRRRFLPLYARAHEKSISLLRSNIREGLEADREELIEMVYAMRDSLIADEMVIVGEVTNEDENSDPEEHADTATTVTNSLKDFIKSFIGGRFIGKKRLDSTLHTINEVISIIRGVVG